MNLAEERKLDAEQFDWLCRTRRSIFVSQFAKGKPIPDEIVMQLLENANWAPTHKKTEPWRFTVFTGTGLKKLADFQSELYKKNSGEQFKQAQFEKLSKTPQMCSHIIAIGMKRSTEVIIPEIEEIAAVACAVQNLYLSTTAYGIGGYWTTGGVTFDEEAKGFFGLGPLDKLLGFFYLGQVEIPPVKGTRGPIEDKTIWVR